MTDHRTSPQSGSGDRESRLLADLHALPRARTSDDFTQRLRERLASTPGARPQQSSSPDAAAMLRKRGVLVTAIGIVILVAAALGIALYMRHQAAAPSRTPAAGPHAGDNVTDPATPGGQVFRATSAETHRAGLPGGIPASQERPHATGASSLNGANQRYNEAALHPTEDRRATPRPVVNETTSAPAQRDGSHNDAGQGDLRVEPEYQLEYIPVTASRRGTARRDTVSREADTQTTSTADGR